MKTIRQFTLTILLITTTISFAQVGINTATPAATLDVTGKGSETTSIDGIIAPRLTGEELHAKDYSAATNDATGAIVYVTSAPISTTNPETARVVASGYYYFDGAIWQIFGSDNKESFSINGFSTEFTQLGDTGNTFIVNSYNVNYAPLTWSIESTSGDINNVSIDSSSGVVTYDVPNTASNQGKGFVSVRAIDAIGQEQVTTVALVTIAPINENELACNGNLQTNSPSLVSKFNLFALPSTTSAYSTYISQGNAGNVNVSSTGDNVVALEDANTGNALTTWTNTTGHQTVNAPSYISNSTAFNNQPALSFDATNDEALGIVTGNASGAFKLVFLLKISAGGTNATILSAVPSNDLGANDFTSDPDPSWQLSRDADEDFFILRTGSNLASKDTENIACTSCNNSEIAFSTWGDFADNTSHLIALDYDGTTITGYFDGSLVFEATPDSANPSTGNQFRLGTNRVGNKFINMELSEFIIGDNTMTNEEFIQVQAYFLCKYNLDASLLAFASPFGLDNSLYESASQFVHIIYDDGTERVYDKINQEYYDIDNVPTPGLGYFLTPQSNALRLENTTNAEAIGGNQIRFTRGDGSTFVITVN